MSVEDEACIVEFKLILAEMAEQYVREKLAAAARLQRRRLPKQTATLLRTGALAAVARLGPDELSRFASSPDWELSVSNAIQQGAWGRLVADTVRLAFTPAAS